MALRKAKKLLKILPHATLRDGLRFGVGAAIEHSGFLEQHQFTSVIDAGANKGQFSLMIRHVNPGAKIVAFEPLDNQAAIFEKVFEGDPSTSLQRCALGEHAGSSEIHVSASPDSSSLLPISDLQSQYFPGTEESSIQTIQVKRLDDCVEKAAVEGTSLLKIDVQGFELELLKGATGVLQSIGHIYVECSFVELYEGQALAHEVIAFLAQQGFRLSGFYNAQYDESGAAIQSDLAFERV